MGDVVSLTPSREAVDAAWEQHRQLASAVIADPSLLTDRQFMERATKAEQHFRTTFLRFGAGTNREGAR